MPLIMLFFFVNDVVAQKKINAKKLTLINNVVCFNKNSTPVTGIVKIELLEPSNLAYEFLSEEAQNFMRECYSYVDGGLNISASGRRRLKYNWSFKEGKLDGLSRLLLNYKDGVIFCETNYKEGKRDGLSKFWDVNGNLIREGSPLTNGLVKVWDNSGNIISVQKYFDGEEIDVKNDDLSQELLESLNLPIEVDFSGITTNGSVYYHVGTKILFSGVI